MQKSGQFPNDLVRTGAGDGLGLVLLCVWVLLRYFFFASLQLTANNINVVLTILLCCSYNTNDSDVSFFIFGEFKRSRRIQILGSPLQKLNFKDLYFENLTFEGTAVLQIAAVIRPVQDSQITDSQLL